MKHVSNADKAKEIATKWKAKGLPYGAIYDTAMEAMAWKDERHAKEKQQWIEKTTNCIQDLSLERDYLDIMVIEDELVKLMYGTTLRG